MPRADNRAEPQRDGSLIARLSPAEALVLSPVEGKSGFADAIERLPAAGEGACYPVPRRDSHCWFVLIGKDTPAMLAKLCAVDLAARRFPVGQVAQTSVAGVTAVIIRHDVEGSLAFYVLADARRWGADSLRLAGRILDEAHVAVTPGIDFGAAGEGFLRFCYANSDDAIREICPEIVGSSLRNVSIPAIVPSPATVFQCSSTSSHRFFEYSIVSSRRRYGRRKPSSLYPYSTIVAASAGLPAYVL